MNERPKTQPQSPATADRRRSEERARTALRAALRELPERPETRSYRALVDAVRALEASHARYCAAFDRRAAARAGSAPVVVRTKVDLLVARRDALDAGLHVLADGMATAAAGSVTSLDDPAAFAKTLGTVTDVATSLAGLVPALSVATAVASTAKALISRGAQTAKRGHVQTDRRLARVEGATAVVQAVAQTLDTFADLVAGSAVPASAGDAG